MVINNFTLGQKCCVGSVMAANTPAEVQIKPHSAIPEGSIMERLMDFSFSIPDFRRTGKGNHRHELGDIVILMMFGRMSKCVSRADIIESGRHGLHKLQSMNLLKTEYRQSPHYAALKMELKSPELPTEWQFSPWSSKRDL